MLGLLRSGKVDIAFASTPTDMTSLETYPCFPTHSIFVAAGYPCDFEHVYSLEEISAFPLILLERKASSRLYLERFFLQNGLKLTPEIELGARSLLVDLAAIGFGVAGVTEEFVTRDLENGRLRQLKTSFHIPLRGHVHAAGRTPDRRGGAFCRLCQAELIQTISTSVFTGKTHKKPQKALKYSSIFPVAFPRKIGQYRTKTFERKCRRCSS